MAGPPILLSVKRTPVERISRLFFLEYTHIASEKYLADK